MISWLYLGLVVLFLGVVFAFMQMAVLQQKIERLEKNQDKFVDVEGYMESFNNMFDAKMQGQSVSPYSDPRLTNNVETFQPEG